MATLNKASNVKKVSKLVDSGNTLEANSLLSPTITFDEYLKYLPEHYHNEKSLAFMQEKFNPNWEKYVENANYSYDLVGLVEFAKKENIDLLKKDKEGTTLLAKILNKIGEGIALRDNKCSRLIEALDVKELVAETLHPTGKRSMIDFIAVSPLWNLNESSPITDGGKLYNELFTKINANIATVQSTDTFKNLLVENPHFARSISYSHLEQIKGFIELNNAFLNPNIINQIYSNACLVTALNSNDIHNTWIETTTKLIEENKFNPCLEALPARYRDLNNIPNSNGRSPNMELFIAMLKTGKLSLENSNNNQTVTLFENLIIKGLKESINMAETLATENARKSEGRNRYPTSEAVKTYFIKQANIHLDTIDELMSLGLEPNLRKWDKEGMKIQFEESLSQKNHRFGRFSSNDPEIMALSYELHMPPFILERLIGVLDKRYNYNGPKHQEVKSQEESQLVERWEGLMKKVNQLEQQKELQQHYSM